MASLPRITGVLLLLLFSVVATVVQCLDIHKAASTLGAHPRIRPIFATKDSPFQGNKYNAKFLGRSNSTGRLFAGQEVRFLVTTSFIDNSTLLNDRTGKFASLQSTYLSTRYSRRAYANRWSLANFSIFPAFNSSGPSNVRVRVIAAYPSRSSQGAPTPCSSVSHDVWAEFWGLAPRITAWSRGLVYSGYFTFTTPPFPFRVCVKDINAANTTRAGANPDRGLNFGWTEFRNFRGQQLVIYKPSPPLFLFSTPAVNRVGDYAAVSIFPHTDGVNTPNGRTSFDPYSFSTFDSIKLVPSGHPCTYEKTSSSARRVVTSTVTTRHLQYCGANQVNPFTANFIDANCAREGGLSESIPVVGTNRQNPWAPASTSSYPSDYVTSGAFNSGTTRTGNGVWLVGYMCFASAGYYDVCVSTRAYRRNAINASFAATLDGTYARDALPVWFKAYNANTSNCLNVSHLTNLRSITCQPTNASLLVQPQVTTDITWTMADRRSGSWGEITFIGNNLNYSAATRWDHSSPRDYAYLDGGDQFRLVHESHFTSTRNTQSDVGNLYKDANGNAFVVEVEESETNGRVVSAIRNRITTSTTAGNTLFASGEGYFKQLMLGVPGLGTSMLYPGCFYGGDDNYGNAATTALTVGNPSSQCCTAAADGTCTSAGFCSMTDSATSGPNAAANLGGAPRSSYAAWKLDGSGTTAYGFIRVPQAGRYRVCYRRRGESWRELAASSGSNSTFVVQAANSRISYTLNDTSAGTWGPVRVASTGSDLGMTIWNYYTAPSAGAVGSALKIVTASQNCYFDTAQPRTYNTQPGALECLPATSSGTTCRGSAYKSATQLFQSVYFYIKIPSYIMTNTYRLCFREKDSNWVQLSASSWVPHSYMTSAAYFHPTPAPSVTFFIDDRRQGTLAVLRLQRTVGYEPTTVPMNLKPVTALGDGDIVRLIPNGTDSVGGVAVGCDMVFGSTALDAASIQLQEYNIAWTSLNQGIFCNASSTLASCAAAQTQPTNGGINGQYPYTNINWAADDRQVGPYDAAVASFFLPTRATSSNPRSYKVCYKPAKRNWIEARDNATGYSYFAVSAAPTHSFLGATTPLYTGSYAGFLIGATNANDAISWSTAAVKLVDFAGTCRDTPKGTSNYANSYASSAGFGSLPPGRGYIVDATNASQIRSSALRAGTSMTVQAFMVLPTLNSSTSTTLSLRLCFASRGGNDGTKIVNWQDLSSNTPIVVQHLGVTYTAEQLPQQNAVVRMRAVSNSYWFNTNPNGDAMKLVAYDQPCAANTTAVPTLVDSSNVGISWTATVQNGTTDLGPSDQLQEAYATADFVMPTLSYAKLCFRPTGLPWMEVAQASETLLRVYPITFLSLAASDVSSFAFTSDVLLASSTGIVAGGAASGVSGTPFVSVTLSGTATLAAQTDQYKIVRFADVNGFAVPRATCASTGVVSGTVQVAASTTSVTSFYFNFPTTAGVYAFCYRRAGTTTWFQVPTSATHGNPFTVADSMVTFAVPATSAAGASVTVTVTDTFGNSSFPNQGAVSATDYVYLLPMSNGTCGLNTSTTTYTLTQISSGVLLFNSTNGIVASRATGGTVPLPGSGSYKVCYYRSQQAATNGSAFPLLRTGHYQLRNGGATLGSGSDYLILSIASAIVVDSCPGFNSTYRIKGGRSFLISARYVDATGNVVPYSKSYVTAAASSSTLYRNFIGTCNAQYQAQYNAVLGDVSIASTNGAVNMDVALVSSCPFTGCTLAFQGQIPGTSTLLTSATTCRFGVQPTVVTQLLVVSSPATCSLDATCFVRAVAYNLDRSVAYAATDAVTINVAGANGVNVVAYVGGTQVPVNTRTTTTFTSGVIDVQFVFSAASFANMAQLTQVSISFTANLKTSPAVTVRINKPQVVAVHIVDVYPTDFGTFTTTPLLPSWEPSRRTAAGGYFGGGNAGRTDGSSIVTAANNYHLVAGQFYTVALRAVGTTDSGALKYITNAALVDPTMLIGFDHNLFASVGNQFISTDTCASLYSCQTNFSTVAFTQPLQLITFRVKNSLGCSRSVGGCNITFTFNGKAIATGSPTILQTPVRSVATMLVVQCMPSTGGQWTTGTCPTAAINQGWTLRVVAMDDFGAVDEYFDGNVIIRAPTGSAFGFTTTADLASGSAPSGTVTRAFTAGVATVTNFTTTRPCVGCTAEILTDWGANMTILSVTSTSAAARLQCGLSNAVFHCDARDANNNCITVTNYNRSASAGSLLYQDTRVCIDVRVVDANGNPTYGESNWIYWTTATVGTTAPGNNAVTVTDDRSNTGFAQRYKPLQRSYAQFCFTATPADTTKAALFNVQFGAQQFGGSTYWASGSGGRCTVGPLLVMPKKVIGSIAVQSMSQFDNPATGLFARSRTTDITTSISFVLTDHYGTVISSPSSQLTPLEQTMTITSDFIAGPTFAMAKNNSGNTSVRGDMNVTLNQASIPVTSSSITASVTGFGIGEMRAFYVLFNGSRVFRLTPSSPTTAVSLSAAFEVTVLNAASTVSRVVAFFPGQSPLRYWINGTTATTSASPPALFDSTCWTSTCATNVSALLNPLCDDGVGSLLVADASNTPIRMGVFTVDSALGIGIDPVYLEPISGTQLDIAATYAIGVSVGSQPLTCNTALGASCTNDMTLQPRQVVAAYGATAATAAVAVRGVTDALLRSTKFVVAGMYPSSQASIDSKVSKQISSSGPFTASAVGATNLTTSRYWLGWSSNGLPASLKISDVAMDSDTCRPTLAPCYSGTSGTCAYSGVAQSAALGNLQFNYSQTNQYAGVPFPVTIDVLDSVGRRVWEAVGTVTASLRSAPGCNNGGFISVSGSALVNGRATLWITFSQACQSCFLDFVLTPDATQSAAGYWSTFDNAPTLYLQSSRQIVVQGAQPNATHAVMTTAASTISSQLTIATPITLSFASRTTIGNLAVNSTDSVTVYAYNTIVDSATNANWWWYGNGGVLRPSTASGQYAHHTAMVQTVGGKGTLQLYFTRTCTLGCQVTMVFLSAQGDFGSFKLPNAAGTNTFTVKTSGSKSQFVGFTPRVLYRGAPTALSFWEVGSELSADPNSPVVAAGVAFDTTAHLPTTAGFTVLDDSIGTGGTLDATFFVTSSATTARLLFPLPCASCQVTVGPFSAALLVNIRATHLRPVFNFATDASITTTTGTQISFNVRAFDDNGIVDVMFGDTTCTHAAPFFCKTSSNAAPVDIAMSADGTAPGLFDPMLSTMTAIANSSLFITPFGSIANGYGTISFSLASPVQRAIPIFRSLGLTSAISSARNFTVPVIQIPSATLGLTLTTAGVGTVTPIGVPTVVYVAMISPVSKVITSAGNNPVTAAVSSSCPSYTISATFFTLVRGLYKVSVTFNTAPSASATTPCAITFTAQSTTSATCATCTASVSFNLTQALPTMWSFVRPTAVDTGSVPGPMYAAANERNFISVQLSADSIPWLAYCPTCVISLSRVFVPSSPLYDPCSFSSATGAMDANGYASVNVTFPSYPTTYRCRIQFQVYAGGSLIYYQSTGLANVIRDIEICTPASIAFAQNTTKLYGSQLLSTGVAYSFPVNVLTQAGQVCNGDGMDDGTWLELYTVDMLGNDVTSIITPVNVNTTVSNTAAFVAGTSTATVPASIEAQVVRGTFGFQVIFTGSTAGKASLAAGIRLKVSSPYGSILSASFRTVVAASMLRFSPSITFPSSAVVGLPFITGPLGSTTVAVQAVDAIPASWIAAGLSMKGANVARGTNEFGSTASVTWSVVPQVGSTVPLQTGSSNETLTTTMVNGTATWSSLSWVGSAGQYSLSVVTTDSSLKPTASVSVIIQKPTALRFVAADGGLCTSTCQLAGFIAASDVVSGTGYMTVKSVQTISLTVAIVDSTGAVVTGDSRSVLQLTAAPGSTVSLVLGLPPDFATTGPILARVSNGYATFKFGFVGGLSSSTTYATSLLSNLALSCPTLRPSTLLMPGESVANPCYGLGEARSKPIWATNSHPASSDFLTPIVLASRVTFKLRSPVASLTVVDYTQFPLDVVAAMNRFNASRYNIFSAANARLSFVTTACLVTLKFGDADLGSSVCTGSSRSSCSFLAGNAGCPPQTLSCDCRNLATSSTAKRANLLRRYLLQSSNSTSNATRSNATYANGTVATALEFYMDLNAASAYTASSIFDIAASYRTMQADITTVFAQDSTLRTKYSLNSTVLTWTWNMVQSLAATDAPTTLAPLTPTPGTTSVPISISGVDGLRTMAVWATVCASMMLWMASA